MCKALESGNRPEAEAEVTRLADIFGKDSVYLEIQEENRAAGTSVRAEVDEALKRLSADR